MLQSAYYFLFLKETVWEKTLMRYLIETIAPKLLIAIQIYTTLSMPPQPSHYLLLPKKKRRVTVILSSLLVASSHSANHICFLLLLLSHRLITDFKVPRLDKNRNCHVGKKKRNRSYNNICVVQLQRERERARSTERFFLGRGIMATTRHGSPFHSLAKQSKTPNVIPHFDQTEVL